MADPILPVNALITVQPLTVAAPERDSFAVSPQLAAAPPGTLVDGFVVNRDNQGNPILRTPSLGDVLIKSDVFIKTGSEVVFRVEPAQAGSARIISIDGLTPQDYAAQQARGLQSDTVSTGNIASLATNPSQTMNLARGTPIAQPLQAVLLSAVPPSAAMLANNPLLASALSAAAPLPAGLAKLQQGAVLKVNLLNVQVPQAATAHTAIPGAALPTATQMQAPTAPLATPPNTPGLPPAAGPAIQSSQPMANANTARIAMQEPAQTTPLPAANTTAPTLGKTRAEPLPATSPTTPSNSPTPSPVAAPLIPAATRVAMPNAPHAPTFTPNNISAPAPLPNHPNAIVAVAIGKERTGEMVLQSPLGTMKLMLPRPIPIGSVVQIEIQPATPQPTPTTPTLSGSIEQATTLARDWPSLEDAMSWTQANDPALARSMVQAMPHIGPKLTSGLLFFIAAVKGGDLQQLVGAKTLKQLESKLPDIAARLKGDMVQLQQLFVDPPLQHWQTVMVPMFYDGQLEHARLFFRHDQQSEEGGAQGKQGKDQRFILEVDLSHLGEMQFDGFVRSTGRTKQFDLMVRNTRPLPSELMEQIRGTFDTAMQTTGLKGYLAFQTGAQHFVRPMADRPETGGQGPQPILA